MVVRVLFSQGRFTTENSDQARQLYKTSRFGELLKNGTIRLSAFEAIFLLEKEKVEIIDGRNKPMSFDSAVRRARKGFPHFWVSYIVFHDLRSRGYVVKTALKFGAQFRVYDRGVKPGEKHAKWIVFPSHEKESFTWKEWSAKNRVAHSTKKRLLLAIVDDEDDVSYWEARWLRP